jgi:hypothetical protein
MKTLVFVLAMVIAGASVASAMTDTAYGKRSAYAQGDLRYPDFSLRFLERELRKTTGTALGAVTYTFAVIDKDQKLVSKLKFTLLGVFDNVKTFEVGGRKYAAEMFYTTTDQSPVPQWNPTPDGHMKHDEIVVWDEASARASNLKLAQYIADGN